MSRLQEAEDLRKITLDQVKRMFPDFTGTVEVAILLHCEIAEEEAALFAEAERLGWIKDSHDGVMWYSSNDGGLEDDSPDEGQVTIFHAGNIQGDQAEGI